MSRELNVNMSVKEIVNNLNIYNLVFGLKVLKVVHGYKYNELARMMDIAVSGIYSMVKFDDANRIFKEVTLQRAIYRLQLAIDIEEKNRLKGIRA